MRLLYVVDNSFYDFNPDMPSQVYIRSTIRNDKLQTGNLTCYISNSAKTREFLLAAKTVIFLTQCSVVL